MVLIDFDKYSSRHGNCVRQNAYYLRRFSFPRVLLCPAVNDGGCEVISDFGRHLRLCETLPRCNAGVDPMPDKLN